MEFLPSNNKTTKNKYNMNECKSTVLRERSQTQMTTQDMNPFLKNNRLMVAKC